MIPRRRLGAVIVALLALLCVAPVRADVYDCAAPPAGISFLEVFGQLADGLECNDDGEIYPAPGKRLGSDAFTKVAFFRYVARVNPTISVSQFSRCSSCNGAGGRKGIVRENLFDLGRIVEERCSVCGGAGGSTRLVTLTVTYRGTFPPWPDSPRVVGFRNRLNLARDGQAQAQLEVAKALMEGKVVAKSVDDARQWFTKAAVQGERGALAPLASLYMDPGNSFHDFAYGLALSAVADPAVARNEGPDFASFEGFRSPDAGAEAALALYLQVLEAGLLAPRIAQGLADKAQAAKMLSPDSARKGFPPKGAPAADERPGARGLFIRGVCRYLGYGFAEPDRREGLRLIESAACLQDADALFFLGLHFDAGTEFPESSPTAWAFYEMAAGLGSSNPVCQMRLKLLSGTDLATDWQGVPKILLAHLRQGRFTPELIGSLVDLSNYRTLPLVAKSPGAPNPFDVSASQESPLSKAEVVSKAQAMLRLKLKVVGISTEEETVFRKCWDDGTTRFYAVSGVVKFIDSASRHETAPYTVCFKVANASAVPTLLHFSAGSALFGDMPPECGRGP